MADQLSSVTGGLGAQGLGGLSGALQGGVSNIINTGSGFLDKWFPPEKREELKSKLSKFATEKPALAGFILSNLAISGLPLALFFVMTLTVFVFSLIVALLVGVLGALLFTVFCVGVALIILLPTLFITTFAASFIFLWGVAAYYIVKWFNEKPVPGLSDMGKDISEKSGLGDTLGGMPGLNGDFSGPPKQIEGKPEGEKPEKPAKQESKAGKPQVNGTTDKKDPAKKLREQSAAVDNVPVVGDASKKVTGLL